MSDLETQSGNQPSTEPQAGDPNLDGTLPESTPSTQPPEPAAPRGLNDSGLRFTEGDGVPSWAVGKTAKELLATAKDLYSVVQTQSSPSPASAPSSSPAPSVPPPSSAPTVNAPDPSLIYSNPDEYHRQMVAYTDARIQAAVGGAASSVVTPMASLAKREASRDPRYTYAWEKYAPEIETIMARVPEGQRGNVDLWSEAASIVQGRHVDEIAQAKAEALVRAGADTGSLPTQGGAPMRPGASASGSPIDRLFSENHPAIKDYVRDEIGAAKIREHASKRGYTEQEYADMIVKAYERKVG